MTQDDKFHVFERLTALWESHGKTVTGRTLELCWETLAEVGRDDFDAAVIKASKQGKFFANEIRELAREAARDRLAKFRPEPNTFRCHAHEEHPDIPSANPTQSWCDRCRAFVAEGRQTPDRHAQQSA